MWTLIKEEHYPKFISNYPRLEPFSEDLKLHTANGYIFLPRHFYQNYPHPYLIKHIDKTFQAKQFNLKFTGELRPHQPTLVQPFIHKILNNSPVCGGLQARPGAGKTVMGVYIACMSNLKTIVMIDNEKLAEQWMETFLQFTSGTENDIGWIKGNNIELDKPFIIAMVQTLMSKVKRDVRSYYQLISSSGIGLALLDEYHGTTTGPSYAKGSLLINTPNVIGLSATPYGIGLASLLMMNIVGPVLVQDQNYELIPKVTFVTFNTGLDPKYGKQLARLSDLNMRRAKYNKLTISSDMFYWSIGKLTYDALQQNHRVLTIVFTTDQVQSISDYLLKYGIENIQFYSKQKQINKETDKVLVATYRYTGRGFDYKALSCCIIASPLSGKVSLEQVIGRVVRECENKTTPIVYILLPRDLNGIFLRDIPIIQEKISNIFQGKCEFNRIDF